jgi:hypothetical protein
MKIIFSVLIAFLIITPAVGQNKNNIKFRGGMLLHTGYLKNERNTQAINGNCFGIGGQLSYTFNNHLRFGTEGYASSFGYKEQDGYYKLGWGGILFAYQFAGEKVHPVIGLTIGGGKVKDLFFISGDVSDDFADEVIYRKYNIMLASPAISLEYSLKDRLTLIAKLDFMLPVFSDHYKDFAYGPRLYLGILFNRS